jgi:hypothetical protein
MMFFDTMYLTQYVNLDDDFRHLRCYGGVKSIMQNREKFGAVGSTIPVPCSLNNVFISGSEDLHFHYENKNVKITITGVAFAVRLAKQRHRMDRRPPSCFCRSI